MSLNTGTEKEDVVHITMEYYLAMKKENGICSNMGGPRDHYIKWCKSEKDEHHITSMWNLKKMDVFTK